MKNKLLIAAAGSGKTTFLVNEALSITEGNVLITTFTETNRDEIKKKIIKKKKYLPKNITVQTWFSFLLQHGVRPYQSLLNDLLDKKKIGFCLSEGRSGFHYYNSLGKPVYYGEDDFFKFYFTKDFKMYSDKISRFVYETNKKSEDEIIKRISRIYKNIFVDEVQDLAGWDLEVIQLLIKKSNSQIILVGDPRQAVYETNQSTKNPGYRQGKIKNYIEDKCRGKCTTDDTTLSTSHRNNTAICNFSSNLYPNYTRVTPCDCEQCRNYTVEHEGIFLIKEAAVKAYTNIYNPQVLRFSNAPSPELTFGLSKGLTFKRILIYPTSKMKTYLKDGDLAKIESICSKFYVAITRARYSIGIVYNYSEGENFILGIQKY